ncbi:hypothetical protein MRX96_046570 [Rhipicephalus microplus]
MPENSVAPTVILDERLFTLVALSELCQHSKATKGLATNTATSANIPPEKRTSQACKASFCRLQQPGGHPGSRGSSKQWSMPKTFGVVPERHQPEATNQATKNPAFGETSQQAPPPPKTPSQQTSSKTPDQSAPRAPSWRVSSSD